MRMRPETVLIAVMSAFTLAGLTAVALDRTDPVAPVQLVDPVRVTLDPTTISGIPTAGDAEAWFQSIRAFCNPVEVETRLRWQPAPESEEGVMREAACYALAGKIDRARSLIEGLPLDRRFQAAGVVFNAGHPAADAGDELAAGPLMELVVEFWPNHYMALYHAGASSFQRGDYDSSEQYLTRFLAEYSVEDGWRSSALTMLEQVGA